MVSTRILIELERNGSLTAQAIHTNILNVIKPEQAARMYRSMRKNKIVKEEKTLFRQVMVGGYYLVRITLGSLRKRGYVHKVGDQWDRTTKKPSRHIAALIVTEINSGGRNGRRTKMRDTSLETYANTKQVRQKQMAVVADALLTLREATALEIVNFISSRADYTLTDVLDVVQVRRRLSDLQKANLIEDSDKRRDSNGRRTIVWRKARPSGQLSLL